MKVVVIIALEPTRWQKFLDWTCLKRFAYDEINISIKESKHFYERPNSKIRMIKISNHEK
ncbi:MAG: hypothetical protein ACJAWW_002790 [Sulfurimonas sp.]|jgi:hypothetical protein